MIEVDVAGGAIPRLSKREVAEFARTAIAAIRRARAAPFTPSEVSIAFVDDEEMKRLNRRFRGRNRTTDVLTFPAGELPPLIDARLRPLGDIVISVPQARRQATAERHSLAREVRYLLLHGILHALGYDHETDQGVMNALELRIRERLGLR